MVHDYDRDIACVWETWTGKEEQDMVGLGKQMYQMKVRKNCVSMWERLKNYFNLVIEEQYSGVMKLKTE